MRGTSPAQGFPASLVSRLHIAGIPGSPELPCNLRGGVNSHAMCLHIPGAGLKEQSPAALPEGSGDSRF